jgi:hypothetical protein
MQQQGRYEYDYEPRYPFGAINLLNLLLACTPYVLMMD